MPRSHSVSPSEQRARVQLGQAINRAMKDSSLRTQMGLAAALGTDQRTVSRMIRGEVSIGVERIAEIEDLCDLPRGQILTWGGFVDIDHIAPADPAERVAPVIMIDTKTHRAMGEMAADADETGKALKARGSKATNRPSAEPNE